MMCLFKRKKKKKEKPMYVRNDKVVDYKGKVKEAFGSVKYGFEDEYEVVAIAVDKQCMAITRKGNRCKNKALEEDIYCYRHRAIHG